MNKKTFFVTAALPYANGPLHIGHIAEYIQADIWVRAQRMSNNIVYFICADDAHGAPIMIQAEKEGISPYNLIKRCIKERPESLTGFHINFDFWYSTESKENHELSKAIYMQLLKEDLIERKKISQFYDEKKCMFLPDRYIKGTCPRCKASDQYGDSCESCGLVYSPSDLIHPRSVLTDSIPVLKESDHLFLKISDPRCINFLNTWLIEKSRTGMKHVQQDVLAKSREWLNQTNCNNLKDWDISRDAPYFGIEIPNEPGKYFYVWLDAPIGYLASLKAYCNVKKINFDELLNQNSNVEQVHFIGKDIIYFHTLFWPTILKFSGRKTPDAIFVHGFITINGKKLSKSRGNIISPLDYLTLGLDQNFLRYYIASKLTSSMEDIDLDCKDFVEKVNSDLVGKYINIASRASKFIEKYFNGTLNYSILNVESLKQQLSKFSYSIKNLIESREYRNAVKEIMKFADETNRTFEKSKPWLILKNSALSLQEKHTNLQSICSETLARFKAITISLAPIIPELAIRISKEIFLEENGWSSWDDAIVLPKQIGKFNHMIKRIDEHVVSNLFQENN